MGTCSKGWGTVSGCEGIWHVVCACVRLWGHVAGGGGI